MDIELPVNSEARAKSTDFSQDEDSLLIHEAVIYERCIRHRERNEKTKFWVQVRDTFVQHGFSPRGPPDLMREDLSPYHK